MDSEEMMRQVKGFLSQDNITKIVLQYTTKGRPWVKFNFNYLIKYSIDLAEAILQDPQEYLKAFNILISNIDGTDGQSIRFYNLPNSCQHSAWTVRNHHVGKFIALKGLVSKISSPEQICKSVRYECPSCGNIMNMLTSRNKIPLPFCVCGRKGSFKIISKEFVDIIKVGIVDDLSDMDNMDRTITREKMCILEKDLASKQIDMLISPGKKVIINGYLEYIKKRGDIKTEYTTQLISNYVEFPKRGWDVVDIDKKTEAKIKKLAKDPYIVERLAQSVVDVEGADIIKLACMLQLAGSPHLYNENKQLDSRGTIHILLIGDPGSAKSTIAKNFGVISPIHSYQSCANASGKGLVASVVNDAEVGGWVVYPGVVPLASEGIVVLDEMDKTHQDDYGDHNHAMNDMQVPVAKANVKAVLITKTSYLATANPKHRVFSNYEDFYRQIDIPKDLMDRFDVIFPMVAPNDEKKKDKIMDIILDRHTDSKSSWKPEFEHDFIRKYVAYCRQNYPHPKIDKKFYPFIKKQLNKLMKPKNEDEHKISFRHMESILRFAYASALLRMDEVNEYDIKIAFKIKYGSFKGLGIIDEYGFMSFDVDSGVPVKERTLHHEMQDILKHFLPDTKALADIQEVVEYAKKKGLDEVEVDKYIDELLHKGDDFFSPRRGTLKRQG